MLYYSHKNGYGNIDIHSTEYQLGRELYDTQVAIAKLEKGLVDQAEVKKLLIAHCKLIHLMGELRSDYRTLQDVIDGKAIFEHEDRSETRRIKLYG